MPRIRRVSLFAIPAVITLVAAILTPEARGDLPATTRVSVATDGTQAGALSDDADISSSAAAVAFESDATNLVSGDTNAARDIFVRNRSNGTTERVSVADDESQATGRSDNPDVSATGQFVAFDSAAANLVAVDANANVDVFRRDRNNNATVLVSQATDGTQGDSFSTSPFISGNGNFVVFSSFASNLVAGDADADFDAFLRDIAANTTVLVSLSDGDVQSAGADTASGVSDDGNLVLFNSAASLVTGDTNLVSDVYVRNRSGASTEAVSVSSDEAVADGPSPSAAEAGSATSVGSSFSADGRFAAFSSDATNLVAGDTNAVSDVFVRDRTAGTTRRVSVDTGGTEANGASTEPQVSPDGRLVVFTSAATNLIQGDTNGVADVFVHDLFTGRTDRVSEGSQANGASGAGTVANSTTPFAAFSSAATNLVSGDTNGAADIFVRAALQSRGYLILDDVGGFFTFGDAQFFGSVPGLRNAGVDIGSAEVIDMAVTPTSDGYLALDDVGGIFAFGDAVFQGSVPGLRRAGTCTCPAGSIDISITASGQGYYILDDQGGIFTFGDAAFKGSLPSLRASGVSVGNARAIDIAVTPTGDGYWILDEAGGVYTFGDAAFFGSVPGLRASGVPIGSAPGIRFEASPTGNGYLVLDGAGGIFTFGDARFFGSIPGLRNAGTVVGPAAGIDLAGTPSGDGYDILDDQGGIFTFGDAVFFGSVPQLRQQGVAVGPAPSIRIDTVD